MKRAPQRRSRANRLFVVSALFVSALSVRADLADAEACPSTAAGSAPIAFTDATDTAGVTAPLAGMMGHTVAVGDVNGDGGEDLFVGTFADRPVEQYQFRGATGPSADRLLLGGPSGFTPTRRYPICTAEHPAPPSPTWTATPTSTW